MISNKECGISTSEESDEHVQPPVKHRNIETPNAVWSVAEQSSNIQATSKSSDQSARMRRLI